ncbi:MAG: peptide-methionine (S)-S-oxide reductase [Paracoccaceae bacterium]|jgi:peptide-methionine (S)-S-oxide reductase
MNVFGRQIPAMPTAQTALRGRANPMATAETHFINGRPLSGNVPDGFDTILLGMGCFWGAERLLWQLTGVWVTSVGYAGGVTPNPTYDETCTGKTGHTEVVAVTYDPDVISLETLLKKFWENHDPTQGMRQGNDRGSQYRSAIFTTTEAQLKIAEGSKETYNKQLFDKGYSAITTDLALVSVYYFAEEYHQQYLAKNPGGYCNIGGTGVSCPTGLTD